MNKSFRPTAEQARFQPRETNWGWLIDGEADHPAFRLPGSFTGKSGSTGWRGCDNPQCRGAVKGPKAKRCPTENGGCGFHFPPDAPNPADAAKDSVLSAAKLCFVDELIEIGFKDADITTSRRNPTPTVSIPDSIEALGIDFDPDGLGVVYVEGRISLPLADYLTLSGVEP